MRPDSARGLGANQRALPARWVARGTGALAWVVLVTGCATPAQVDHPPDTEFRKAHVACYQRMMAASQVGQGVTPNRHLYLMCMKAKGYDV